MSQKTILKTKLFRPRIPNDFVDRTQLFTKLDRSRDCRLILVSASAGYGKSVTISRWLELSGTTRAWLSMGENDSDLMSFFHYFLTAIHHLFPDSCGQSRTLLNAPFSCSWDELARELVNDLSEIPDPFHLVLDDYGFIHDPDIHSVLNTILEYDLPGFHLILISRSDPPFNLAKMRGKGALAEVRQRDLQFSLSETQQFLGTVIAKHLKEDDCLEFHEKLEGWPAGTRMVALGLGGHSDIKEFTREMRGDIREIRDYLVAEVLLQQPASIREYLISTSILNRMCPSLCEALCDQRTIDGRSFLKHLETSNLFFIPLDEFEQWFRYHHLFQSLLLYTLEKRFSPEEVSALHKRAYGWLSDHGFVEDAMHHALKSGDTSLALSLVANNRCQFMEKEEWHQLRRLIGLLPVEISTGEPEILMIGAWSLIGFPEMNPVLDSIEKIMLASPGDYPETGKLWGEFWVLRSLQSYLDTDGQKALEQATLALDLLPEENGSERGFGVIMQAVAMQMKGETLKAQKLVLDALKSNHSAETTYHTRLLSALCFVYWMDGTLKDLQQTTTVYLELGQKIHLSETVAHGHFFLGASSYEMNDIETAHFHLSKVVEEDNTLKLVNRHNYIHSGFALACVYLEMGTVQEARSVVEEIITLALSINNPYILTVTKAFEADIALRLGFLSEALSWSQTYDATIMRPGLRFYTPRLTLAKVYLAEGTPESLGKADSFLKTLAEYFRKIHNFQFLIKVLALQALLSAKFGNHEMAIKYLTEAFVLAEPRGFVRTFVDLGEEMADLLTNFPTDTTFGTYATMLLASFPADTSLPLQGNEVSLSPLTNREHEIISMLHKRLSNQEIADKLFISYGTVKRHTANIYKKLLVKNRREAVSKALSQKIIS